ncbi:MAG: SsrA-binding protein SmpB [Firmicutes bacterium]|nr:SsrA-binding protein SmpB [Bacillota bacterium]
MMRQKGIKVLAENRRARHEYFIEETYEAGVALRGTEVKSIRAGRVNLRDSFARVDDGQLILYNVHVSPYEQGNRFNHDPLRPRVLLMHKREIMRLLGLTQAKGYTLVPTKLYLKNGKIKVEIGLAKGKKLYDKRDAAAERDAKREIARAMRARERGEI